MRLGQPAAMGLLFMTAALVLTAPNPGAAQTPRIVAVGDVHGAFEPLVEILQAAGVIDKGGRWSGGSAIFVQTGDIFDRGAGVRQVLDLLMRLEGEARRAGGRVEVLLGNHEVMNLVGDFRDVSPQAYAAFADARSDERRRRAYDQYARIARAAGAGNAVVQTQAQWMADHPPGFLEYVEALAPRGKYGRWLRERKTVTAIANTGFMHAGIDPQQGGTLEEINRAVALDLANTDQAREMLVRARLVPPFCTLDEALAAGAAEINRIAAALKANAPPGDHVTREFVERVQELLQIGKSSLLAADGPLWFRGFAQWPDTDDATVSALLQRLGVNRFVTGHTPSAGRIRARFGGRIVLIDSGMLSTYFKGGRASALELQNGQMTAIFRDGREVLQPAAVGDFERLPLRGFGATTELRTALKRD